MIKLTFRLLVVAVIGFSVPVFASDVTQQTFLLQPGWNTVFLTVQPDDGDPDTDDDADPARVFGDIAGVERVWAWLEPDDPVQFVQDADEIGFNDPGWYGYLPPSAGPHASAVTNLFKVLGARPYLVKIDESVQAEAQMFSVSGVPVNRRIRWTPDSFTLTGFAVDTTLGVGETPTFREFLGIPVSKRPDIYSLNPSGEWQALSANTPIQAGQVYWIKSDGSFGGSGPLDIDRATLNGVDFLDTVATRSLTLTNRRELSFTPSITVSDNFPLVFYQGDDPETKDALWASLASFAPQLVQGKGKSVKLGVDRSELSEAASGIVTIRGGKSEIRFPVYAQPKPPPYGLYVGTVAIRAISEANEMDFASPTPVVSELYYRLLLHYGADGNLSLLKTVYLMAEKGEAVNGITPVGSPVLVTDENLLGNYATLQQGGGVGQGYRLSSPVFDFDEPHRVLSCDNPITDQGLCQVTLTIAAASPTHPMRHQYHPNHDGKLPNGQPEPNTRAPYQREIWDITRALTFEFNLPDNNLFVSLSRVTGTYTETITGMHKNSIRLRGDFALERVNSIDALIPQL